MTAPDALVLGACALVGYLIGSVNIAVLVARRHGVDILRAGSGNPGATNVKRVIGKGPGNLVFALDALKGAAGAGLPALALGAATGTAAGFPPMVAGFAGVLLGHCFSCFLGFRGGKGVASTIGGLLVLLPVPILVGAATWVAVFGLTRYVSLASLALGLSLPLSCWLLPQVTDLRFTPGEFWFAASVAAFNVWTHRSNLGRLLAGTENRFSRKP
jgi:acyl phosphate:glycerol-3-phosphate acyltransferase